MKKGFLKCFYGYRNRWDELLFRWVIDYIDIHYTTITDLDVEVADSERMQAWRDRHHVAMTEKGIALGFTSKKKKIHFISHRKNLRDNFSYTMYFFGGGELFAESRWFHGGWNYLFRYFFAINSSPYVLLGGFEKATKRRQKILYKYILPKAEAVVCRDQISYQTVSTYVNKSERLTLHEDFAVKIIQSLSPSVYLASQDISQSLDLSPVPSLAAGLPSSPYALVNLIEHRLDDDVKKIMQQRYQSYMSKTESKWKVIYFPCTAKDTQRQDTLTSRWISSEIYDRTAHTIEESVTLFAHADAVVGSRLHFLLPAQILDRPRLAISYAEKIDKLITSTIEVQN